MRVEHLEEGGAIIVDQSNRLNARVITVALA
jgi:hypothetical protein